MGEAMDANDVEEKEDLFADMAFISVANASEKKLKS